MELISLLQVPTALLHGGETAGMIISPSWNSEIFIMQQEEGVKITQQSTGPERAWAPEFGLVCVEGPLRP